MSLDLLQPLFDWIGQHPNWAGLVVFLVAFSESLAIVGLFMPGVVLMFAIGALVALGTLDFWPTFWLCVAGAVAGDGVSFWLGAHFKDQLRGVWPFSRYPALFEKGEAFFLRHGGKSILFGRFVGAVRPIVPVTAGMLGMPGWKFLFVNVLSALAWAPAYLLPGVVFGASLGVAAEVASRLVVMVVLVLALLWFSVWLVRRLYAVLAPRAGALAERLIEWGRRHRYLGQITAALVDPQQAELKGLSLLAIGLLLLALLIFQLTLHIGGGPTLTRVDSGLYHMLQGLRTPWGDQIMIIFSQLGDGRVHAVLVAALLLWLLAGRRWLGAAHWLAAALFGGLMSVLLKQALQVPRPNSMYEGAMAFSFPSAHAVYATCIFGFLAVLLAREVKPQWRWLCYAAVMPLILGIAFSRLYLGAHWFSDVVAGLLLGLAWVLALGVAYRRHIAPAISPAGLIGIPVAVLLLFGAWHSATTFDDNVQRYSRQAPVEKSDFATWLDAGWQYLPAFRSDTLGTLTQPLNLQWAGPLDELQQRLSALGWQTPAPLSPASALNWLNPQATLESLPPLPHVHDGRHASLTMVLLEQRLIIKLWPANLDLNADATPVWLGYVGKLERKQYPLLTIPRLSANFDIPLQQFKPFVALGNWRVRYRTAEAAARPDWHGEVLLLWSTQVMMRP